VAAGTVAAGTVAAGTLATLTAAGTMAAGVSWTSSAAETPEAERIAGAAGAVGTSFLAGAARPGLVPWPAIPSRTGNARTGRACGGARRSGSRSVEVAA
jgi:hypothetical protein